MVGNLNELVLWFLLYDTLLASASGSFEQVVLIELLKKHQSTNLIEGVINTNYSTMQSEVSIVSSS